MDKHYEQSRSEEMASSDTAKQLLSREFNTHLRQVVNCRNSEALSQEKLKKELLEKYGVERIVEDGVARYRLPGSADGKILLEAKVGASELTQSQHRLGQMVQDKLHQLYDQYHVTFGKEGEDAVRPKVLSKSKPGQLVDGPMAHSRVPRLSELMGVEAALFSSQPSQFTDAKNHALKFYFLKEPMFGHRTNTAALYASDLKNNMAVFFEPDLQPYRPITVEDSVRRQEDLKSSFESLAVHEIAHNGERNMGTWNLDKFKPTAEKLGWTLSEDSSYWLIKGQAGELFRRAESDSSSNKSWIRCDTKGSAVDEQGRAIASYNSAPRFSNSQVRDRSLLKPPTSYFTNPDEMLADSLMLYRVGDEGRKILLRSGPDLFNAVKDFDQAEVDLRFGKTAAGVSRKIRQLDGKLVDNTLIDINLVPGNKPLSAGLQTK